MPNELRNLTVTKIALVRKGYKPVNDGARITVVKAEQEGQVDPAKGGESAAPSLSARLTKAILGVLGNPTTDGDVEKSVKINDDGTHAAYTGKHAHPHTGKDGEMHAEEHSHDGDASHDHDCAAPMEKAIPYGTEEEVKKLEVGPDGSHANFTGEHEHEHVSHVTVVHHGHNHTHDNDSYHDHSHVEKATSDAAADAKVTALIAQLEDLITKAKAAQEKDNDISKAIPTAEVLKQLVAEEVNAALEPVVKAMEDLGIERARAPRTPNVTTAIAPTNGGVDPKEKAAKTQGMGFSEALRYLVRN